jgi:hypothetical protein
MPRHAMRAIEKLAKHLANLPIPDPSLYDMTSEVDKAVYRERLIELEARADFLVRDIVKANVRDVFAHNTKLATTTMKHLEKWRLHANASIVLWDRSQVFKSQNENRDIVDSFMNWLGVKGTQVQRLEKEEKELSRAIDRWSEAHVKILREHELLLEALQVAP